MFRLCTKLQNINFGNTFNTSKVTDMRYMFDNCGSLTSLDLSSFNTSNVTDMNSMFLDCINLVNIYANSLKWVISSDCSTKLMFYNCGCSSVTYK